MKRGMYGVGCGRMVVGIGVGAVLLVSCGEPTGPDGAGPVEELPRPLTLPESVVIERSTAFGVDLLREVVEEDERPNVILSPLSASMALGMTLNGAAGSTLEGMTEALGFGELTRDEINDSYLGLLTLLDGLDPAVDVSIANSIWANEEYPFHPSFFDAVAEHFDAPTESRDFASPATLAEINDWVDERTDGRIERILEEGELDPALAMLLLNAVDFVAPWETEFDPDETTSRSFTREDGSSVTVEMMSHREIDLPFGGNDELVAAELPYGGGAFAMLVAVPRGTRPVREIATDMGAADWGALIASLEEREVDQLSLPRFELAYDVFLNDALSEMGMDEAFTSRADFSELSPEPLCIDFVRQKTFIEVDESGTRASAVTGVGIGPTSFTGLIADRPFLFAIRERLSGTILFIGLVGDPTHEESGAPDFPDPCRFR